MTVVEEILDASNQEEVSIMLVNQNLDRSMKVYAYDRVAQIIFKPILDTKPGKIKRPTICNNLGSASTGVHFIRRKDIPTLKAKNDIGSKLIYKLGEQLTSDQTQRIHKLMRSYEMILATSYEDIKGSKIQHKHDIDVGDSKPIKQAPYKISLNARNGSKPK